MKKQIEDIIRSETLSLESKIDWINDLIPSCTVCNGTGKFTDTDATGLTFDCPKCTMRNLKCCLTAE